MIHSGRQVPPRVRELYDALSQVNNVATEQVNLSRLQLALRGLESEVPLIRVAGGFYPPLLLCVRDTYFGWTPRLIRSSSVGIG